jgi:hypothetical protein
MRNLKRASMEIKFLQLRYGKDKINFARDGAWIKIKQYPLPPQYNQQTCTLIIIIPENYDSVSVAEVYTTNSLKIKQNGKMGMLGNWHSADIGEHSHLFTDSSKYMWICFHPGQKFVSLLDFMNTLRVYFINPAAYSRGG